MVRLGQLLSVLACQTPIMNNELAKMLYQQRQGSVEIHAPTNALCYSNEKLLIVNNFFLATCHSGFRRLVRLTAGLEFRVVSVCTEMAASWQRVVRYRLMCISSLHDCFCFLSPVNSLLSIPRTHLDAVKISTDEN